MDIFVACFNVSQNVPVTRAFKCEYVNIDLSVIIVFLACVNTTFTSDDIGPDFKTLDKTIIILIFIFCINYKLFVSSRYFVKI